MRGTRATKAPGPTRGWQLLACLPALLAAGAAPAPSQVQVGGARVIGASDAARPRVAVFRGLPYARPPLAGRRFRPSELLPLPESGELRAERFAAVCPQDEGNVEWYRDVARGVGADPSVAPALPPVDEDCLYLNLWTPAPGRVEAGLPVLVWVHGGGNLNGWSHEPNYRGAGLAERGLVVVSVAYRLGALGFLAHPWLSAESPRGASGHYGLGDLVTALQWIQRHVRAFGGDPGNVTLIGESAGGGNVAALLRVRAADGLYRRAIIQSGALGPDGTHALADAERAGERILAPLGARDVAGLRALPWRDFVGLDWHGYYPGVVVDGALLAPGARVREGVDLLIGSNAQEWLMYQPDDGGTALARALASHAADREPRVRALLASLESDPRRQADRLFSASEFVCPGLELAERVRARGGRAFAYRFTRVRPGAAALGAYHGAEIPYVFDSADDWLPSDAADRALTRAIGSYWAGFARDGRPAAPELPAWPPYDPGSRGYLVLGERIAPGRGLESALCLLLGTAPPAS